jgi:hypothetical protein
MNFSLFSLVPVSAAKKMARLKIVAISSPICKSVVVKKRLQGDATFLGGRPTGISAIYPKSVRAVLRISNICSFRERYSIFRYSQIYYTFDA